MINKSSSFLAALGCSIILVWSPEANTKGLFPYLLSDEASPCRTIETISSTYEPPTLAAIFLKCIKDNRGKDAIDVFSLMIAYATYDRLRVESPKATGALGFYQMQLPMNYTGYPGSSIFVREFSRREKSPDDRVAFCENIKKIGKPSYFPEYMIRYIEDSLAPSNGDGLKPDFSPEKNWEKTLEFMSCAEASST